MPEQTITITDVFGQDPIEVPVTPNTRRESGCVDLVLVTTVHVGCPVYVNLLLRTDGSVDFWQTHFGGGDNPYAHVDMSFYRYREPPQPTEAQRYTVARWWAGDDRPLGLAGGVGKSLLDWAFPGWSKESIEDAYLGGRRILLA